MNKILKNTAVLATCLVSALPMSASAKQINITDKSAYQMSVVVDRSHGAAVLTGDYNAAITHLQAKPGGSFNVNTNLCVAYTLTGSEEKAHEACATAVEISARRLRHGASDRRNFAVALSNQGVLKAISGDLEGAAENFEKAVKLRTSHQPAKSNLEKYLALGTVAGTGQTTGD